MILMRVKRVLARAARRYMYALHARLMITLSALYDDIGVITRYARPATKYSARCYALDIAAPLCCQDGGVNAGAALMLMRYAQQA